MSENITFERTIGIKSVILVVMKPIFVMIKRDNQLKAHSLNGTARDVPLAAW